MQARDDAEQQNALPVLRALARPEVALDLAAIAPVLEASPIGVVLLENGVVAHASPKAIDLIGLDPTMPLAEAFLSVVHELDQPTAHTLLTHIREGRPTTVRVRVRPPRGPATLEFRVFVAGDRVLVAVGDVSLEASRTRDLARFRAMADATSDMIAMADVSGTLLYVNPALRRFHGIDPDAPADTVTMWLGVGDGQRAGFERDGWPQLLRGEVWEGEFDVTSDVTGEKVPFWGVWVPTTDEYGDVDVITAVFRDLSERRRFERRLEFQASHDPLTGLPNRDRLFEVLAEMVAARKPIAVLFCDLDDFKIVNDTMGHGVGDQVLRTVADRLLAVSRGGDVVGRLGGDEFLVICEGIVGEKQVFDIADRISDAVSRPIVIGDREYRISSSIGISVRQPGAGGRAGDLVTEADIAMYRAKEAGRQHIELFDATMRTQMADRLDLERDLRLAIENDQIEPYFQPIMDVGTGRVDGIEALVRWNHPERGLLQPSAFLELAESSGMGVDLGDIVIDKTCALAAMVREIDPAVLVGFNVSTSQLRGGDLCQRITDAAARHGVPMSGLVLEVTEETVMTDADAARALLQRIRSTGVRIAVDDFGTGYSSLSMLRKLPADILKIDRTFVDGLGVEPGDTQIVRLVLSLAEELGLVAVGEGVETAAQRDELARLGSELAQGYLFAEPMPVREALDFVRRHNP